MASDVGTDAVKAAGRSVDFALAEFNSLRAEAVSHVNAQYALIGVTLTALGVIFGFVVKEGGDRRLLLAVPPLMALVSLLHASATYRQRKIACYVRTMLLPYVRKSCAEWPSWDVYVENLSHGHSIALRSAFVDGPPTAIFFLSSLAAVIFARGITIELRALAAVLTVATVAPPFVAEWLASRLTSGSASD